MSRITDLSPEELEARLEQVANLHASWEARLEQLRITLKQEHAPIFDASYNRFKLCIDELEAVLTGKPLP